ncbi:mechanosensitive ion channel [Roseiconus nitratireducens]|uniref:Mechanosensitive ion channel n=1 Tax=Roseiconus nitratireducens TaxID=2605748 RepID=A0A5M6CV22_9BACT|nr:mechanosensitive ion channel domain-containing protein [Roseiconus nitratireducens]KAA5539098.1 mechanosensitive ion channel [Roseiconus nitratireducens]
MNRESYQTRPLRMLSLVAALVLLPSPLFGQSEPLPSGEETAAVEPSLTVERIEQLLRELEQTPNVTEEDKTATTDAYRSTVKELQAAQEAEKRHRVFVEEAGSVNDRLEQVKAKLQELGAQQPTLDSALTLPELEQLLPKLELQLTTQKKARKVAEDKPQTRSQRRKEIRERLVSIQEKRAAIETQLTAAAAIESPLLSSARGLQLKAYRIALDKELIMLEAELAKYDAEDASELIRLQADLAARQTVLTEKSVEQLQERIKAARQAAAELSVRRARREAIAADPALQRYADRNQELAEKAKEISQKLAETEKDLKLATEMHDELNRQFNGTRQKVELVGLTSSVGALLRKQRTTLPDVSQRETAVAQRQAVISDMQYLLFEYEDERQELGDIDALVEKISHESALQGNNDSELLESATRELLTHKSGYLDALIRNSGQYFDTLVELDTTDRQVIALAGNYANYIDERVLWIRSGRALLEDFDLTAAETRLVDPTRWSEMTRLMLADCRRHFAFYLLVLIPLAIVLVRGASLRRRIARLGETAQKANCRSVAPTLRTMLLTGLVSIAAPGLLGFVGWRLKHLPDESGFCEAIGQGLLCLAVLWVTLEYWRQVCRPTGLGVCHFRWSAKAMHGMRRQIHGYSMLALPFAFLTGVLSSHQATYGHDSLERTSFLLGMCVIAVWGFRLMRPAGPFSESYQLLKGGWIDRLKPLWPWIAAFVPLALACLAVAGYYYTAQILFWRFYATLVFIGVLVLTRSLLLRMLLLRRRYLSMEQARKRAAAAGAAGEEESSHPVAGIVTEDSQSDITTHSIQSRRLVTSGLLATSMVGFWLIWVQVLPALAMLDKYPVWETQAAVASSEETAAMPSPMLVPTPGEPAESPAATSNDPAPSVVTYSDLALAVLIACVTFVLFRNGPGLLEMSVLQQLPVDASVRYAITTLVSYAIVLVGIIATCSTIGLQWSQIQWLATALTFGLAFGLQEMFANFVAGLIILLERPIRVGDIVTVDDVTGVVSRIRIRATSITNWDRKEYVVPNKEFITGRLLNWTLSDKINRITINIGVAYGSDTERARELLLAAANDHPAILKDPPSLATFEGFGDNSLNLVLRTFLPTLDNRLEVIHQLHTTIDKAFRKEGIEIAFPQRDLHIRSYTNVMENVLEENRLESAGQQEREAA